MLCFFNCGKISVTSNLPSEPFFRASGELLVLVLVISVPPALKFPLCRETVLFIDKISTDAETTAAIARK